MKQNIRKFLIKSGWVMIGLFIVRYLISPMNSFYELFGGTGEVLLVAEVIMSIYERFLWKINPFEKTPKLYGSYNGDIEYRYNDIESKKEVRVEISQTLLSISVKIFTDEITSNTVVGNLIEENKETPLYYTYITNPKSKYSDENPIQYGSCRLRVVDKDHLSGIYWTSRGTKGDISLKKR